MIKPLALWVNQRVAEQRGENIAPPGGSQTFRAFEANGAELTIIARGDSFDVYQGKKTIFSFMVTPRVLFRMVRWFIWTWWILGTWCGLKTVLWNWSLRRIFPAKA